MIRDKINNVRRNVKVAIMLLALFTITGFSEAKDGESGRYGLLVTVIQDNPVLSSREEIDKLVDFSAIHHVEELFVQIYRANKAWFPSEVGDSRVYEECLKTVGEDPFKLLIKKAHARGIKVHAWLNLLSLSANEDAKILKKYGPEILTKNLDKKKTLSDYKIDNQYFLEPGDMNVRKELLKMVEEILSAYPDLDGMHFDYIRYPDTKPDYGYTKMNMDRFKRFTGERTIGKGSHLWKDWKRRQVTELLRTLVEKTRVMRPEIAVSSTGCAPYMRAYF
ncbi:MAG: family 10 glycosylhydrolase, partial [Candidatus Omnitrophica bacterium]|nr:family 10 glycosylhydrolase [Candidatus Omnitrophota bacterium]